MPPFAVTSPDGTAITVEEWGNPAGREILFIHGFCQSRLSWRRQVEDAGLAARFRMVTFDLRGHGASARPMTKESYDPDRLWADDVAAVVAAAGLRRPFVVGWSYAGRVIADYLRVHGGDRFAGINYVNGRCSADSALFGPAQRHLRGMQSDDLATNIAGSRAFLRACFAKQPTSDDFETMLAFNMMVPAAIRRHVLGRPSDTTEAMAGLACPVLVTHGRQDEIILATMAEFVAATVKGARLSFYEDCGHAPFWEDPARFNAELAAFVDR